MGGQGVFLARPGGKILADLGMIDRAAVMIVQQIALADISDVAGILVFGEQMVEGLVARRSQLFGNGFIPILAVGKLGIDIEYDAAKVEKPVAHDIADAEPRLGKRDIAVHMACHIGETREKFN